MHIILIHQFFLEKNDGGGSRFNEMTKVWSEMGHKVTVIAGMVHYATGRKPEKYRDKKLVMEKYDENVTVWRCHVSEAYNKNFIGRLWAYFSFVRWGSKCARRKLKEKYDLVLVTSPPLFVGIIGRRIARRKKIPLVFEVRDLWPESAIDTGVLTNKYLIKYAYKFEKKIYKASSLINTLTPAFYKKLKEEKGVPEEKLLMIPNAADFTLAEKVTTSFNADEFRNERNWQNKFVIVYVGAHGVANHLVQLIDAAEKLQDTNVHFVLIGDGMKKAELKEDVAKRNLSNVEFVDPVPKADVFKYILGADMGTSVLKKVDTFKTIYSNKTFDYMSCKKPILLLIDGVSRDLVETAKCGVYAEPENTEAIVEGIKSCISLNGQLDEMGKNGYEYAKTHFDRNVLAKKYIDKLQTVSKPN